MSVILVDGNGRARLADADRRAQELLARAAVPEACGPEIPVAPARAGLVVEDRWEMVPGSTERRRVAGHAGRKGARVGDAFDRMAEACARRKAGEPFTPGQVSAGRDYAALVERLSASGVRCSSLEAVAQAGAGGGSFIDAVVQDARRLASLRRRIGGGVAIEVRRVRPSRRGTRRAIPDLVLVEMVCCGGLSLSQVLDRHAWSVSGDNLRAVRLALAAALDRMQGWGLVRGGR